MQRSWSRIFALTLGIPMLLALLAACGSGTTGTGPAATPSSGSTIIKLATDLPVSGGDASIGKSTENGAHLAVDQANQKKVIPGYTLQFDPQDDVGPSGVHDPAKGANNITSLIGDGLVAGVVGPFNSNVAVAEEPIANNGPLALISPSNTNPCLTKRGDAVGCGGANDKVPSLRPAGLDKITYFRLAATDDHQGPAMADYLYNTAHLKKAFVIDDTETYGAGIAKYFIQEWTKLGGTVLDGGKSHSVKSTTSYVNLLTQAAAQHPDVIYFGGVYANGGTLIGKQMQTVPGLKNVVYAGGDGIQDTTVAKAIGTSGPSVYATVAAPDATKIPAAQQFIKDYQAVYGDIGPYSATAYDAMNILIQAVKTALTKTHTPKDSSDAAQAKVFRQAVIDALKGISYDGVTGHTSFDENGDTTNKIFTIYQVAEVSGNPDWKAVNVVTVQ